MLIVSGTWLRDAPEHCARCGVAGSLFELTAETQQALQTEYHLWCGNCAHLTMPGSAAFAALRAMPQGAIGLVVAVPLELFRQPIPGLFA